MKNLKLINLILLSESLFYFLFLFDLPENMLNLLAPSKISEITQPVRTVSGVAGCIYYRGNNYEIFQIKICTLIASYSQVLVVFDPNYY